MTTKKISALGELAVAPATDDKIPVVDVTAGETKRVEAGDTRSKYLSDLTGESIEDFSDVDSSMTPTEGQGLIHDGAEWTAQDFTIVSGGSGDFVASGAIANGDVVVVKSDGTAEIISNFTAGAGTAVNFDTASSLALSCAYDSTNSKVVVAYSDTDNSSYGTAIVGTITGTSISWGTGVVFVSGDISNDTAVSFDEGAGKVLIAYVDFVDSFGRAIVGTVSGTSISFGTPAVFDGAGITRYGAIGLCYDPINASHALLYAGSGSSGYGTALVATISGTTVSFGTPTTFDSAGISLHYHAVYNAAEAAIYSAYTRSSTLRGIAGTISGTTITMGSVASSVAIIAAEPSTAYDTVNEKCVTVFRASAGDVRAAVVTLTGTSVSFGTSVQVDTATGASVFSAGYDSTSGEIAIAYKDANNSNYGTAVPGTVSGTSISFGSTTVLNTAQSEFYAPGLAEVVPNGGVLIIYRDQGNSGRGTGIFWIVATSTNVTTENVIGFASAAINDTDTGTITMDGGLSTNQSGLTTGDTYYVDDDGTLTTTGNGRKIGRALSATSILVQTA